MNEQVSSQEAVTEESTAPIFEISVGEQLRQAREARGLKVADISQTLKLGPRQVEALENGDWQHLPGPTFIRGFVRNYARLMQLDAVSFMAQLDQVLEKPVDNLGKQGSGPAPLPPSTMSGASGRDRQVISVGLGLVVLAALAYFLMPADLSTLRNSAQSLLDSFARKEVQAPVAPAPPEQSQAPVATSEPVFPPGSTQQQVMYPQTLVPAETSAAAAAPAAPAVPVAQPAPQAAVPAPQAAVPAAGVPQLRFLFDKDSWIEVRDRDNKVVFSQRQAAGGEQAVSGQGPLSLTIGYAPGVRLFWRGQPVDLAPHTRGDVARLVLE